MLEGEVTLVPVLDSDELRDKLVQIASLQQAQRGIHEKGVMSPLVLDRKFADKLYRLELQAPDSTASVLGVVASVEPNEDGGFIVGVHITCRAAALTSAGVHLDKMHEVAFADNLKLELHYVFDWYEASELRPGLLIVDSISR